MDRPTKITFREMRDMGVRGVVVYYADYKCSHSQAISADGWADDVRLSHIERTASSAKRCGKRRGGDVRGVVVATLFADIGSAYRRQPL